MAPPANGESVARGAKVMSRREFGRTLAAAVTVAALGGALWVGGAAAQESPFRVEGRVLWISGQTMVVAPYGLPIAPSGTSGINVDLSRVSQDEYMRLITGDSVLVTGTVTGARDRVIARSVQRTRS
jgi:hypothetical protein